MAVIKFGNKKYVVELKDEVDRSIANEIFKFREYRASEEELKAAKMPVLDIGAHIGLFSLYVRALNPRVPIIAFEPERGNYERLDKIINDNQLENIRLEKYALGVESGIGQLVVSADSHNHRLFMPGEIISGKKMQEIKKVSLSDYCQKNKIKKVSLIKLDIEGGEFTLLKKWTKTDFNLVDSIVLEYHDSNTLDHRELVEIIKQYGFGVQVFPSRFERTMGYIFAKRKRTE